MYYTHMNISKFEDLQGKTLASVSGGVGDEQIIFVLDSGESYRLYYEHDCCASCSVEDIVGDFADLIGNPLLLAEESTSDKNPEGVTPEYQDSFTWTFYRLRTIKGTVSIRWYGESNGYYSESVSFGAA
jgi:hypothetical protein